MTSCLSGVSLFSQYGLGFQTELKTGRKMTISLTVSLGRPCSHFRLLEQRSRACPFPHLACGKREGQQSPLRGEPVVSR